MKKGLKRFIALISTFALVFAGTVSVSAVTFTPEQLAAYMAALQAQQAAAAAAVPAVPAIPSGTLVVGDSITALSYPYVAGAMPGAIINARSGRPFCDTMGTCGDDGLSVLSGYAASGTLPKKVVVALGSNNNRVLGLAPLNMNMMNQLYNICGPDRTVYLVTNYALGGNVDLSTNNAVMSLAARTYPNFKILNWAGKAASHPEWIDSLPYDPVTNPNGFDPNFPIYVHPTTTGSVNFARTLAAAK